tara:strand:+ start:6514 stop:6894 length:381 start_codon:yes stop_codon:yes gene_type:complete
MSTDYDRIARFEKAISKKYGKEAIKNPKGEWTDEKEKEFIEQMKEFYNRLEKNSEKSEKEKVKGVLVSKRILSRKSDRECPVCEKYSFERKDDLYMNKFQCCFDCFILHIEGREERWLSGWRPEID